MRNAMLGFTLLGALTVGTAAAHAGIPSTYNATVQPVYWSGDYCGPGCQEHRWRRHERWEARQHYWHHRRWEERHYGYYTYPRY
jgi:hypothetical protein